MIASLDVPIRSTKSQTIAVLLAFFGGMLGLHHFYRGNNRRGWWNCALFWTLVPLVLGFVGAFRIALLDDAAFRNWTAPQDNAV